MLNPWQKLKNQYHYLQALIALTVYRYPAKRLKVIGVTGTDGKTTTSTLIYYLLKNAGFKVALISTVAAYIGNEQIDTGFHVTSPDPAQLQRLLRHIADLGYTHVVLESTSHGLDQFRLLGTNISTAVVTNVTHEHFDYHKTYENYLEAKAKIFTTAKHAIINEDDASFGKLIRFIPVPAKVHPYSLKASHANSLIKFSDRTVIHAVATARFPEKYNQSNALAASMAAVLEGVTPAQIETALPSFTGIPGRMQAISNPLGMKIIVDFAHTPNALDQALQAARGQTKGKLIVVFGAAGKRDISKRPLMGKVAAALADEVILTAEDPRGEDIRLNIAQIKSGAQKNQGHLHGIPDRREAIAFALSLAHKGDLVMVCGKGHEQSMNLDGTHEIPWSDVTVVGEELKRHGRNTQHTQKTRKTQ